MLNIEPIIDDLTYCLTNNFNQSVEDEVSKRLKTTKTSKNQYQNFLNINQRDIEIYSLFNSIRHIYYWDNPNNFLSDDEKMSDKIVLNRGMYYFLKKQKESKFRKIVNEIKKLRDKEIKLSQSLDLISDEVSINDTTFFELSDRFSDNFDNVFIKYGFDILKFKQIFEVSK